MPFGLPRGLPAHISRERAREDAAALRAEIAQLRDALADLLVGGEKDIKDAKGMSAHVEGDMEKLGFKP